MLYKNFRHYLVPEHLQNDNANLSHFTFAVDEKKGSSVPVSLTCTSPEDSVKVLSWTFRLQRWSPTTRKWSTIGTRTGYTSEDSPGNRTFTGVTKTGQALRVVLDYSDTSLSSQQWMY